VLYRRLTKSLVLSPLRPGRLPGIVVPEAFVGVSHSDGLRLSALRSRDCCCCWEEEIWRGAEMVGRVVFLRRKEMPLLSDMSMKSSNGIQERRRGCEGELDT